MAGVRPHERSIRPLPPGDVEEPGHHFRALPTCFVGLQSSIADSRAVRAHDPGLTSEDWMDSMDSALYCCACHSVTSSRWVSAVSGVVQSGHRASMPDGRSRLSNSSASSSGLLSETHLRY